MDFKYYGGRGITVAQTWLTYEGFVASMGLRPDGLTIDRINGDKNYEPGNCRWESRLTQSRNRKYTVNLTYGGKTQKIWQWAEELGILPISMHHRKWMFSQGFITSAQLFKRSER